MARKELGGNVVNCNADLFRDFHPRGEEIKHKFEAYYPELTSGYAQGWKNGLREYCEANRLNYIMETTFSSGSDITRTIAEMKGKDYRVEIKLLAVHPRVSFLGTQLRFENMKEQEGVGRIVDKEGHDWRYQRLAPTVFLVQTEGMHDKLQIYGLNYEVAQGVSTSGVRLLATNPPNALQVFQQEIDRKWPDVLQRFFDKNVQRVIDMKAARNAPVKEIEIFRKEIQEPYPTQRELQLQVQEQIRELKAAEKLDKRLAGQLPHISIAGTDFIVDLRLGELREADAPTNSIQLHQMQASRAGEAYLFFYHTQKHTVYDPPANIKSLPKNVVVIEMPVEARLDPVGTARMMGADVKEFVKVYPIQNEITAIVKPLSQSGLPELIQQNLRKEEQKRQEQDQKKGRGPDEDLDRGWGVGR